VRALELLCFSRQRCPAVRTLKRDRRMSDRRFSGRSNCSLVREDELDEVLIEKRIPAFFELAQPTSTLPIYWPLELRSNVDRRVGSHRPKCSFTLYQPDGKLGALCEGAINPRLDLSQLQKVLTDSRWQQIAAASHTKVSPRSPLDQLQAISCWASLTAALHDEICQLVAWIGNATEKFITTNAGKMPGSHHFEQSWHVRVKFVKPRDPGNALNYAFERELSRAQRASRRCGSRFVGGGFRPFGK